ncbi:annexin D4 isoform X1 [Vitis vinifera]|nr:annexin D4 isoform X1 [Vitis vinifera]|eukprot:XP_002265896.3 PREDICTED: annexin D4 isoform X1 [Vitis vinifera]
MMEVKKDTILVASVKRRKKQTNKEGKTIMSSSDALAKSFSVSHSGIFGVDEKSMLEILVKWQPEQLSTFRNETSRIFLKDERFPFEKCEEFLLKFLKREFKRFKDAVVQWTMHPWERDARMARKALKRGRQAYGLLIELACTRSSDELLGARRAYQSLYSESIEEDVASRVDGIERQLLVALVSSYRYDGSKTNDQAIKLDTQKLEKAISIGDKKQLIKDEEIVRILTTRSKIHLIAVIKCYQETFNKNIIEDLDEESSLKDTIYCLCVPSQYFSKILDSAMKANANKNEKEALTRVIVTRANVDMKDIAEEYDRQYKTPLTQKIEDVALGNYKDFLVTLVQRALPKGSD